MRYSGKSQAKAAPTIGAYYKHTTFILQPDYQPLLPKAKAAAKAAAKPLNH
jgi:hypothetical protein